MTLGYGHLTPVRLAPCEANRHSARCSALGGADPAGEAPCSTVNRSRDARLVTQARRMPDCLLWCQALFSHRRRLNEYSKKRKCTEQQDLAGRWQRDRARDQMCPNQ